MYKKERKKKRKKVETLVDESGGECERKIGRE